MRAEIDGSGSLSSHPLREIILFATLVSVVGAMLTGVVHGYLGAGLWFLFMMTLRSFMGYSLLVIAGLFFLSWAGRHVFPHRVYRILRTIVLFAGCSFLISLMLEDSGIPLVIVRTRLPLNFAHYTLSGVGGAALLYFLSRIVRRKSLLAASLKYVFPPSAVICASALIFPLFLHNGGARKNILFITIDTLRADHLSCYGYERLTSPTIDGFAGKSVVFSNAIVQWPKTSPSFSSMMTSLYCSQTGVTGPRQRLPLWKTTTAEVLLNGGYVTAGVVGNGNLDVCYNFDQGFSIYVETWKDKSVSPESNTDAAHITDLALDVLEDIHGKGNFFLWVHYVDPHAPYSPPDPFHEMFVNDAFYGEKQIKLNEGFNDDIGGCPLRSRLGDNDNLYYYVAQYDAEIRYCDSEIQRLFEFLDHHDLWATTMVILTSDHGEGLGEHNYYFEHGRFSYETNIRVPLIVWSPGCRAKVVEQPVALLDLHPTMLDFAGIEIDEHSEGESLVALLDGSERDGHRRIFAQAGGEREQSWTVRNSEWKLIYVPSQKYRNLMRGTIYELYDLRNDPGETLNLFEQGATLPAELKSELDLWVRAEGARDVQEEGAIDAAEESTQENLKALGYVQ
jgi:arylsulfatase A-like enzyme